MVKIKVFLNNSLSETTPKIGWKINEIPAIMEKTAPDSVPFKWATCSIQRVRYPLMIAQMKEVTKMREGKPPEMFRLWFSIVHVVHPYS